MGFNITWEGRQKLLTVSFTLNFLHVTFKSFAKDISFNIFCLVSHFNGLSIFSVECFSFIVPRSDDALNYLLTRQLLLFILNKSKVLLGSVRSADGYEMLNARKTVDDI